MNDLDAYKKAFSLIEAIANEIKLGTQALPPGHRRVPRGAKIGPSFAFPRKEL